MCCPTSCDKVWFSAKMAIFQVSVTYKVQLFSNIHDGFMASSIETSAKDTLGPIFGDNSKVTSCMKLQKTDISENCST